MMTEMEHSDRILCYRLLDSPQGVLTEMVAEVALVGRVGHFGDCCCSDSHGIDLLADYDFHEVDVSWM